MERAELGEHEALALFVEDGLVRRGKALSTVLGRPGDPGEAAFVEHALDLPGAFDPREAARIMAKLTDAVGALHQQGVIADQLTKAIARVPRQASTTDFAGPLRKKR